MNTPTFPVFNWLPPVWEEAKPDLADDCFEQPDAPEFHDPTPLNGDIALAARLTALKAEFPGIIDHVNGNRTVESTVGGDTGTLLTMVPHPNSDFSHVDPHAFSDGLGDPPCDVDEKGRFLSAIAAVESLQTLAARDGTMQETIQEALAPLRKAGALLAPIPKGVQRLTLIFENNLCKLTVLYGELNEALEMENETAGKAAYNLVRQQYIELLKDLDDHDPRSTSPGVLGYGRALKWIFVRPLIHDGKIKGAKVVAKWNPYMSSSGIPIPIK